MGSPRKLFNIIRKKFIRSSNRNNYVLRSPSPSSQLIIAEAAIEEWSNFECSKSSASSAQPSTRKQLTKEDIAAIKIQAVFRAHLARRAYRALKSLVKLQAMARGAYVRKQAQTAMHCMHALVRLQVRVRARQLLSRCSDD